MAMIRCFSRSSNSWRILPSCRSSFRQCANDAIRPKSRSAALSNTAPPSELPCDSSNLAITGRLKIPGKRTHCVVVCSDTKASGLVKKLREQQLFTMKEAFRVSKSRIIQDRDYAEASQVFGEVETTACPTRFEYGHEGKPFYVSGPHETARQVEAIVEQLEQRKGAGNYHYLVVAQ